MSSVTGLEDHQPLLPASLEMRLWGLLGRAAGLLLLVVSALLWTAVITWSVTDPSLTHATGGEVKNTLGPLGAIAADLVLEALGLAAALALLAPMVWGLDLMSDGRLSSVRAKLPYYLLLVVTSSAALSSLPRIETWPMAHGLGGIVGDVVTAFSQNLFAILSPERAGLATSVFFTIVALSLLAPGVGLERRGPFSWNPFRRRPKAQAMDDAHAHGHSSHPYGPYAYQAGPVPYHPGAYPHGHAPYYPPHAQQGGYADMHAAPDTHAPEPATPQKSRWWPASGETDANDHRLEPRLEPSLDGARGFGAEQQAPAAQPFAGQIVYAVPAPGMMPQMMQVAYAQQMPPQQIAKAESAHQAHWSADAEEHAYEEVTHDPSSRAIAERFAPQRANMELKIDPFEEPRAADHAPREAASNEVAQPVEPPRAAKARRMPGMMPKRTPAPRVYKRPEPGMLKKQPVTKPGSDASNTVLRGTARLLEDVLADFGVKGEIRDIKPGPVVTLFEFEPARGTKTARIIALADDIARSMSAKSARVSVVPGRNAIGIELPNTRRDQVGLRELLESQSFTKADGALPLALGRSIGGEPVVADLARMPHLLVAGTTGSGKSVGVNAMILSILFRHTPEECRFLMIDPKMLELSVYNGIPHLLAPVVTEPHKAVAALNWAVNEMEERYKRMARLSVRNIEAFNARIKAAKGKGEQLGRTVQTGFNPETGEPTYEREDIALEAMPYIVVVVDEFADLMITAGKDIETAVQRLAQKARAAGIHLIMATQRPSVDIITGTIKANFPTRISFKVASKIDSRTILNEQGAEHLLGQGDMLFAGGSGQTIRVHGPFVSDEEVEGLAQYLRSQGEPRYVDGIGEVKEDGDDETPASGDSAESLYDRAVALVLREKKASTSYLQRRLGLGYNRAADLIERMEKEGLISPANHAGKREILAIAS